MLLMMLNAFIDSEIQIVIKLIIKYLKDFYYIINGYQFNEKVIDF